MEKFPSWRFAKGGRTLLVHSADEAEKLSKDWFESPAGLDEESDSEEKIDTATKKSKAQ